MNLRNMFGAFVAVAAFGVSVAMPAQAQDVQNISTFGGAQTNPNGDFIFTSNGTNGGTLVTQAAGTRILVTGPSAASFEGVAFLNFGPISQVGGSAMIDDNGTMTTADDAVVATFGGGTFSIYTGANSTGTLLLTGTFGNSSFRSTAATGATLQTLNFGDVIYTGGTYKNDFNTLYSLTGDPFGTFSIGMTAITPALGFNGSGGLNSFVANGSGGTFDAAVPEPGEYAVMGMIGLTLCGLMIRARRRSSAKLSA
ncbi:MAG: hypothetical protein OHK0029_26000 [Armatimonadaceae bacterium]